jgi:hypothetical protein
MERVTQKFLQSLVSSGAAVDVTRANDYDAIPERFERVAMSRGTYGANGLLLRGESGTLYAVTRRTTAIFLFG